MSQDDGPQFAVLERPLTLSDRVTQSVLDMIASATLRPGDKLPSERELGDRFGVSRTVVREALRSLAAKGVLDTRSGTGATVARVDADRAREAFRLYVQGSHGGVGGVTYDQINDVREATETRVSRLAALNATEADLDTLGALHERLCASVDDLPALAQLDVDFHRAVAAAANNPLFLIMLDSIAPILLEIRRRTLTIPGRVQHAVDAHGQILDRIRAHDDAGAEAAMAAHLADSQRAWQSLEPADS